MSRAVSAGNAAAVSIPDYLEYFAADPATAVSLAYVESIERRARLLRPRPSHAPPTSRSWC